MQNLGNVIDGACTYVLHFGLTSTDILQTPESQRRKVAVFLRITRIKLTKVTFKLILRQISIQWSSNGNYQKLHRPALEDRSSKECYKLTTSSSNGAATLTTAHDSTLKNSMMSNRIIPSFSFNLAILIYYTYILDSFKSNTNLTWINRKQCFVNFIILNIFYFSTTHCLLHCIHITH